MHDEAMVFHLTVTVIIAAPRKSSMTSLDGLWNAFLLAAETAQAEGVEIPSWSGKATYRIHDVARHEDRVYIETVRTGRTSSSIGKAEFEKSMDRLRAAGGTAKKGGMNPVGLHEVVIATLHPSLERGVDETRMV
jgi:hypothetical protein